jgi:PTS system N-acetylgalactosamine-specific IIA component
MFATTFRKMKSSADDAVESSESPRAIVAGHGDFPDGLVSAVEQISGRGGIFIPVSNRGLGAGDIENLLTETAARSGISVIFTDLPGGSATLAVRKMMRANPDLVLVTGANLATLLEFVFQSPEDVRTAARCAAEKGRAALGAFGGQ